MSNRISYEQMCRELLEVAMKDGLVAESVEFDDPDPQCRSSGEMVGMANLLRDYMSPKDVDGKPLWRKPKEAASAASASLPVENHVIAQSDGCDLILKRRDGKVFIDGWLEEHGGLDLPAVKTQEQWQQLIELLKGAY